MEFNGTSKIQNRHGCEDKLGLGLTVTMSILRRGACTALYCTVVHCTDHVYPAVEEPVLLDGDEALHLPAELVRGLARHHPRSVELRRGGPPVHLDILPGRQGRGYYHIIPSYIDIVK